MLMKSLLLVGIIFSIIFKAHTLKIVDDAEVNPALYEILESIQGLLNQSNIVSIHMTTDRQCACNTISVSSIRNRSC